MKQLLHVLCSLFSTRERLLLAPVAIGLLLLLAGPHDAWPQVDKEQFRSKTETDVKDPTQPPVSFLDVTNSTLMIRRDGLFPFDDPFTEKNGSFPKGKDASLVFAQGLLWGGQVTDGTGRKTVRVNGSTYQSGMAPGGLRPDGTPEDASDEARFHVWRVDRGWATDEVVRRSATYRAGVDTGTVSQSMIEATREQYRYDWNNWPAADGAPFQECNGQPGYQPADAEAVAGGTPCADLEGDIPGKPGASQTLWLVTNDVGSESAEDASENSYGSPAIGMETQFAIWGYDRPAGKPLSTVNFIEAELIYRGLPGAAPDAQIDSMFVTWWADPDVGDFSDDFVGVDRSRSLGFAYNAEVRDERYAAIDQAPPAVGWDVLKGLETQAGNTLGLSSFIYEGSGTAFGDPILENYDGTRAWYNWMRGVHTYPLYPDAEPFLNPRGEETKFLVPGDPVTGEGWVDGSQLPPGDRQLASTTGPITMEKGDTVRVVVGQIAAQGNNHLASVGLLRYLDETTQFAFDRGFESLSRPPRPAVRATSLDTAGVLNWGVNQERVQQTEAFTAEPGYAFEAYRVYQLPGPNADLSEGEIVRTFDVENAIRALRDLEFDPATGSVTTKPVQVLDNEGIRRHVSLKQDHLRGRPLANGVDYHYAVTAVAYLDANRSVPSRILESRPTRVRLRPRPPAPGTENVPALGSEFAVEQVGGTGTATVTTEIVDPSRVRDATYRITFGSDATGGFWNLLRDETPVLTQQEFGFFPDRDPVDGVRVNVGLPGLAEPLVGRPPETILRDEQTEGDGLVLWGDATLFGAPVGYYRGLNPDLPPVPTDDAQQDLELRFTGNGGMEEQSTQGGQLASYCERAAFTATDPLNNYDCNTIRAPFELYEVERDRQIRYAIIGANADGQSPWGDGAAPENGGYYRMAARDYIVPIHKEYDEEDVQAGGTDAGEGSWLLFFKDSGDSTWETGDEYLVEFANPLVPGEDEFAFTTKGAETGSRTDAKAKVKDIGVFPNPYRGYNELQNSLHDRFVRFTNLPAPSEFGPTTIRIFTLSGTPVRVIKHTENALDPNFADWDLEDADGEPVATGIYLVHVNTPVGSKTLKLGVAVIGVRSR